jgi:hypothetical protein
MNNKLDRVQKEAEPAQCEILFRHVLKGLRNPRNHFSQNRRAIKKPRFSRVREKTTAMGYWVGDRVRFPARARDFSLNDNVQAGCQAHPASYPIGTEGCCLGGKSESDLALTSYLLVPRLKMGALYLHSPPLWSSGQSSWLQTQRSPVRFPALPDFLRSNGSRTGSSQPLESD